MKQQILFLIFTGLFSLGVSAQINKLPVKEWGAREQLPLVLYISGDGGFDGFSIKMCKIINLHGYSVSALNARAYFWEQKTPEQVAADLENYLDEKLRNRQSQQIVLIGYSFGADVLPFVINNFHDSTKSKIVSVILISPSSTTDLEIHWVNKKRGLDVLAEINKMGSIKTTTLFGSNEKDFPVNDIKLKNYSNENLPGGHHFDGKTDAVTNLILKNF